MLVAIAAAVCLSASAAVPDAPTNLLAAAVSSTQISLTWDDVSSDELGFQIERSTDGANFSQIAQVLPNTVKYRDSLVWPGTTYTYRVRAYNSSGNSAYSAPVVVASPPLCPNTLFSWGFAPYPPMPWQTGFVAVAAGYGDTLALTAAGTVVGWGNDDYGEATPPAGLTGVVAVAAGYSHSLALKKDSTVVGWGYNSSGEASPPGGLSGVVAIAAGGAHSLALKNDGTVVGWGSNAYGQASPPSGLEGVVAISAGGLHSLALKSDGSVVAWGNNQFWQTNVPPGLTGVVAIAAGYWHNVALKTDGTVVCWGDSYGGALTPPGGLTDVVAISAGEYFSIALKADGTVVGWGDPTKTATVPPAGLTGISSVAAGHGHCVALTCAPYVPQALIVSSATSNEVDLTWYDVAQTEDGFRIERADDIDGSPGVWTQIATAPANATSYANTTVLPSATYWYRLQAFNGGGSSPYSYTVTVVTPPLAPPTRLTAKAISGSQIQLSWKDNSTAEIGFKVQRAPDNAGLPGTWSDIATVDANVTNYIDGGLPEITRYWYQVAAFDSTSNSPFSNQTNAVTEFAAPSNLVATPVSSTQILLSWTDNSAIESGFTIYRGGYSNDQYRAVATIFGPNVTNWTDERVSCDETWYYQVSAFKLEERGQLYSSLSAFASANTSTADSDGDGLCDCWMLKYFGHATAQASDDSRASDDADGDGMSNLQEFIAGMNPTNSQSALRITSQVLSTNGMSVSWSAVGGKQYMVQANTLGGTAFSDLSPIITVPGTNEVSTNYLDAGAVTNASSRLYRIRLVR